MADSNWRVAGCACCRLPQRFRDFGGNAERICSACHAHRGPSPENRIARGESHEQMLRERLRECRASAERAEQLATEAKKKVASALASRGALAAQIIDAKNRGELVKIATDPFVVKLAQRYKMRQAYDERDW